MHQDADAYRRGYAQRAPPAHQALVVVARRGWGASLAQGGHSYFSPAIALRCLGGDCGVGSRSPRGAKSTRKHVLPKIPEAPRSKSNATRRKTGVANTRAPIFRSHRDGKDIAEARHGRQTYTKRASLKGTSRRVAIYGNNATYCIGHIGPQKAPVGPRISGTCPPRIPCALAGPCPPRTISRKTRMRYESGQLYG